MCVDLKRHFNWLKVAVMAVLAGYDVCINRNTERVCGYR